MPGEDLHLSGCVRTTGAPRAGLRPAAHPHADCRDRDRLRLASVPPCPRAIRCCVSATSIIVNRGDDPPAYQRDRLSIGTGSI